jgi:hypothetical protein
VHDPAVEAEPPRPAPRSEVAQASGLNVLVGAWLIASPWILNVDDADVRALSVVLGAAVVVLASVRALRTWRAEWLSWVNVLIGVGLLAVGIVVAESWRATWNLLVVGLLVLGLAAWSAGSVRNRRSGHPTGN